jgi:hypothetical protein
MVLANVLENITAVNLAREREYYFVSSGGAYISLPSFQKKKIGHICDRTSVWLLLVWLLQFLYNNWIGNGERENNKAFQREKKSLGVSERKIIALVLL